MRLLIFANTYFQLITAIQLKNTIHKNDEVVVVITDRSNNAVNVYKQLKEYSFFEEIVFINAKNIFKNRSIKDKIQDLIQICWKHENRYSYYLKDIGNLKFDKLIFYNWDLDMYAVFSILSEINRKIEVSLYEEGVLSYSHIVYDTFMFKIIRLFEKMAGKPTILDNLHTIYCFYPDMYEDDLIKIKIPQISENDLDLKKLLLSVFNIRNLNRYDKYKYIFFESCYESDGMDIGESEVFLKLAGLVGKENVIIKKHPRSTTSVYEDNKIAVDENSSAPFEIIQLAKDLSHHIFVSTISGSTVSANAIVNNPATIIFIYPLTKYKYVPKIENLIQCLKEIVQRMIEKKYLENVFVLKRYEDIQKFK